MCVRLLRINDMNCNNKVLIIKLNNNDFEQFYNNKIKEYGIDVWDVESLRTHRSKRPIRNMLSCIKYIFDREFKKDIKKYEYIIIFEDQGLIPVLSFLKNKDTKLILWNWNIMSHKRANRKNVFKNRCQIWTFDKSDAEKYGWKCNEQFYFNPEKKIARINNDTQTAFCACVDKGRYITLAIK